MRNNNGKYCFILVIILIFSSCALKRDISVNDLAGDKLIIVGVVEYDFSQLKNKRIKGIDIFLDSKTEVKNFKLSNEYLPKENYKYFSFISKIGNIGDYQLVYQHNTTSGEIDNLISMMEMDKNSTSHTKIPLQNYTLNDCKIINLGKIVVNYKGGEIINGIINYSYSFSSSVNDTTALHALRKSYPLLYGSSQNDICFFKNDSTKF